VAQRYPDCVRRRPGFGADDARRRAAERQGGSRRAPVIGPARQILDRALEAAGIDPAKVDVTNAVKLFKSEPRCLRSRTRAAGALMRRPVTIGRMRGQAIESESGHLWITVHPSYLLRLPDEPSRQRKFVRFVKDLEGAKALLASRGKRTS